MSPMLSLTLKSHKYMWVTLISVMGVTHPASEFPLNRVVIALVEKNGS